MSVKRVSNPMKQIVPIVLVAAALSCVPVLAHHSGAMFDATKTVTVSGTVQEWQYVNPHSWLRVLSLESDGTTTTWSFEGPSPSGGGLAANSLLHKDTFKPGDKVAVETHPMKDGRHAGSLGDVTFADGHKWVMRRPTL